VIPSALAHGEVPVTPVNPPKLKVNQY